MKETNKNSLILDNINIQNKIYNIRGFQVMLDSDFSQRVQAQEPNFMGLKQNISIKLLETIQINFLMIFILKQQMMNLKT